MYPKQQLNVLTMVIKYVMKNQLPQVYHAASCVATAFALMSNRQRKIGYRGKTRKRVRCAVQSIYEELGPIYFKRAYRIIYESFCELSQLLAPTIQRVLKYKSIEDPGYRTGPNGRISPSARLACALRYFAGGDPYDIMLALGIGHTDVGRA
jgi:hypothetical protein